MPEYQPILPEICAFMRECLQLEWVLHKRGLLVQPGVHGVLVLNSVPL